jgi:protein arginine kinase
MLHLPGLVMMNQINQMLQAIAKLGLAVRGLYGEGTEASGNLFQISNQSTLGMSEKDIVDNLVKVIHRIVEHEKKARDLLSGKNRVLLEDRVYRALGVLSSARIISSRESVELLSTVKLGLDFELSDCDLGTVNELFIMTQPAHLQKLAGKELESHERDIFRAKLIRERIRKRKK